MLIILSGSETIHKKFFARKILATLTPDFDVDGYSVNFRSFPYEIKDAQGVTVYKAGSDEFGGVNTLLVGELGVKNEAGLAVKEKVDTIWLETFLDGVRDNHFANIFVDIESDYGIRTDPGYEWEEKVGQFLHPHTYQDVLNNYQNRKFKYHIISGSFSKTFINKIKDDIGAENVIAINIIRHPSVVYRIHEKPESYYIAKPAMNIDIDEKKVNLAVSNCVILANCPEITTIKFEDILKAGFITVEGVDIGLPEGYVNYNDLITEWEKEHAELGIIDRTRFDQWHHFCTNIRQYGENDAYPENYFDELGYTPLTYEQIVAPKE